MQTPRNRNGASQQLQKPSPTTPQTARRLSSSGPRSSSPSSARSALFSSPKSTARRSPKSPSSERHPNRIALLESQISQLQDDLQKAKDQLAFSESQMTKARQEADEARTQLAEARSELDRATRQLKELSECEDDRIRELRKIGQERDRAWQSELEAVQKQHTVESSALLSAVNEIQRLRIHCDMLVGSEAAQAKRSDKVNSELRCLKQELAGRESLIEVLKNQVIDFEKSESEYQESINVIHLQLEMAKNTIAGLRADGSKLAESLRCLTSELEESRAKAVSLEETVRVLEGDRRKKEDEPDEHVAAESTRRETELEEELEKARAEIAELKLNLNSNEGGRCETDEVRIDGHDQMVEQQLRAARAAKSEVEEELQRVKVQAQQWRKAAEVATAIIADGDNGTMLERTESFGSTRGVDEEKKNGNVLKKIGVLLKKGQR